MGSRGATSDDFREIRSVLRENANQIQGLVSAVQANTAGLAGLIQLHALESREADMRTDVAVSRVVADIKQQVDEANGHLVEGLTAWQQGMEKFQGKLILYLAAAVIVAALGAGSLDLIVKILGGP